jgi:S-DNA-T family DNA segregation ATPase FtsK/SpoIIIE
LFLGGSKNLIADVQSISRNATRISAQGRAVGIHLIIATQKPDTKAVNGQIKANLTGIVSFPMATLGASFSILGNGRAKELPATPGRAIWKSGLEQFEVQTPFLNPDQAVRHLDKVCPQKDTP